MLAAAPPPDEIVVGVGPGSYSGIRIGISAAIGLQLAWKIPARGIHSAMGYEGADFQVILDARGSWIYSRVCVGRVVEGPLFCTLEELEKKADPSLPTFRPDTEESPVFPSAAIIGARMITLVADLPLQPLYLKAPHITLPKNAKKI